MDVLKLAVGIIFAVFGSLAFWIYRRLTRYYGYWESQGVKTVNHTSVLKSAIEVFQKPAAELEEERYRKYGRVYGTYEHLSRVICIAEPELIKQVLVKDFHIFTNKRKMEFGAPEIENGLSLVRDEQWKRIRTVVSPSFTSGKLRKMNPLFLRATEGLISNFASAADNNKLVDLKTYFSSFTTDVIGLTAFGVQLDSLNNPDHPFVENSKKIFYRDTSSLGMLLFGLFPSIMKLLTKFSLKKFGFLYFFELTEELIRRRSAVQHKSVKPVDLMQLLLDAQEGKLEVDAKEKDDIQSGHHVQSGKTQSVWNKGKTLSDIEIKALAMEFFLAGHETSATALTFVAYELALNPDVQERLYKEAQDMYTKHGIFNYDVINKMPYLEAVVSETLRLHTVATRSEREASEEYILGSTGIVVPKGGIVAILNHTVHHDPEFFPEPYTFNPDRFLPENRSSIIPYSYIPFSDGPRNCIAMRFALLSIKMCVAMLVRKIKFVATEDTRKKIEYFTNPNLLLPKEVKVRVERRH